MDMPVSKVRKIIKIARSHLARDADRRGGGQPSRRLYRGQAHPSPPDTVIHINLKEQIEEALKSLTDREGRVLKMRSAWATATSTRSRRSASSSRSPASASARSRPRPAQAQAPEPQPQLKSFTNNH